MLSYYIVYFLYEKSIAPLNRARPRPILSRSFFNFASLNALTFVLPLILGSLFSSPLPSSLSVQALFIYFSQLSKNFSAPALTFPARAFMRLFQASLRPILAYFLSFFATSPSKRSKTAATRSLYFLRMSLYFQAEIISLTFLNTLLFLALSSINIFIKPSLTSYIALHICTLSKRAISRKLGTRGTYTLFHPVYVFLENHEFGSNSTGVPSSPSILRLILPAQYSFM